MEDDRADLLIIGLPEERTSPPYRRRMTIQEIVCDAGPDRMTTKSGHHVVIK